MAKLILSETESAELRRFVEADLQLVSSLVLRVELLRAVRRAELEALVVSRAVRLLERFNLRRMNEEILERAAEITPRTLRTLDALHLATALDLSPPPRFFVCYDQRLAAAARGHGLTVIAPGLDEVHEP